MEYKVESFFRGIDFGFEIVEVEVNLRNSVLEGNLGVRFDQLQIEFMVINFKCDEYELYIKQYEENFMVRVEYLEVFVVSMEDDKIKEKFKGRKISVRFKFRVIILKLF